MANSLRDTRRRGQSVIAWIEQHAQGLHEMVRAGWTWAQLAEALNAAGITYAAGNRLPRGGVSRGAWAGDQLQRTARHARLRTAARGAAMRTLLKSADQSVSAQGSLPVELEPALEAADVNKPKVRVFGADPVRPKEEPDTVEQMQAEKVARAKSLIADWKSGR